jgi:hypothetical protein
MTKTLSPSPRPKDDIAAEKARLQEDWFKIVVKILAWKEGLSGSGTKIHREKITTKEWKHYSDRIIKNNVSYNKDRVLKDLKETWDKISQYGGFEA